MIGLKMPYGTLVNLPSLLVANKELPKIGKALGPGKLIANLILFNQLDINKKYNEAKVTTSVISNHTSILRVYCPNYKIKKNLK